MQQGPGTDGAFGRSAVTVKEACTIQPARHCIHVTIQHIAGAMSEWMMVSQNKAFGFCAQLENGFQDIAGGILLVLMFFVVIICSQTWTLQPVSCATSLNGKQNRSFCELAMSRFC